MLARGHAGSCVYSSRKVSWEREMIGWASAHVKDTVCHRKWSGTAETSARLFGEKSGKWNGFITLTVVFQRRCLYQVSQLYLSGIFFFTSFFCPIKVGDNFLSGGLRTVPSCPAGDSTAEQTITSVCWSSSQCARSMKIIRISWSTWACPGTLFYTNLWFQFFIRLLAAWDQILVNFNIEIN